MSPFRKPFLPVLPAILLTAVPATATPAGVVGRDAAGSAGSMTLFQSDERVLVMMRIGNGDLMPMVFDTGSDGATIDRSVAKRLRLKTIGQVQEIDGTTGKRRLLPQVAIRDLTLGGLKVPMVEAASVDYDRSDAMGIISAEMFTQSLLYLDLANNRAILAPRTSTPTPAGAATAYVAGIPSTVVVLPDGSALPAHFDTGFNGALSLPVAMMDKVPLVAPARVVGRFTSINTQGDVYGGRIRGVVRIGPVTLDSPEVTFLGDLANIGLPVIRQVTLVIDAAADRNWILAPGARPVRAE